MERFCTKCYPFSELSIVVRFENLAGDSMICVAFNAYPICCRYHTRFTINTNAVGRVRIVFGLQTMLGRLGVFRNCFDFDSARGETTQVDTIMSAKNPNGAAVPMMMTMGLF